MNILKMQMTELASSLELGRWNSKRRTNAMAQIPLFPERWKEDDRPIVGWTKRFWHKTAKKMIVAPPGRAFPIRQKRSGKSFADAQLSAGASRRRTRGHPLGIIERTTNA